MKLLPLLILLAASSSLQAYQLRFEPLYATNTPFHSSLPYPPDVSVSYQTNGGAGWKVEGLTNSFSSLDIATTSNTVLITAATPLWNAAWAGTNPVKYVRVILRDAPNVIDLSFTNELSSSSNLFSQWTLTKIGGELVITSTQTNGGSWVQEIGDYMMAVKDCPFAQHLGLRDSEEWKGICPVPAHQVVVVYRTTPAGTTTNNFNAGPGGLIQWGPYTASNAAEFIQFKLELPLANGDTSPPIQTRNETNIADTVTYPDFGFLRLFTPEDEQYKQPIDQ